MTWIYDHPVVYIGLLWIAAALVMGGLLGLIIRAADQPPPMSPTAEALDALEEMWEPPWTA